MRSFEQLIGSIFSTVAPTSWDLVGGPNSIAEFKKAKCLVISATNQVHYEIAGLLDTMRRSQKHEKAEPVEAIAARQGMIVKLFAVKDGTEAEVAKVISKFIRPNDWKATDSTLEQVAAAELQPAIGALKGQVIVRHSKHVVDEIQEFLYTSGVQSRPPRYPHM